MLFNVSAGYIKHQRDLQKSRVTELKNSLKQLRIKSSLSTDFGLRQVQLLYLPSKLTYESTRKLCNALTYSSHVCMYARAAASSQKLFRLCDVCTRRQYGNNSIGNAHSSSNRVAKPQVFIVGGARFVRTGRRRIHSGGVCVWHETNEAVLETEKTDGAQDNTYSFILFGEADCDKRADRKSYEMN